MELEKVRLILSDYIMDLKLPKNVPKYRSVFKNASYSRWAANELLRFISKRQSQPITDCIRDFIRKMNNFAKISRKDKLMFLIAKHIGEDILDIFYAME